MTRGTWQGSGTWQTTGGGGGGVVLAVIIAAVLIGSGAIAAIVRALELVLIVAGCAVGLTIVLCAAWAIWQLHQDRMARPVTVRPAYQVRPADRLPLEGAGPAIGPAQQIHLHFHGLPDEQAAAIIRRAIPGTTGDAITKEE